MRLARMPWRAFMVAEVLWVQQTEREELGRVEQRSGRRRASGSGAIKRIACRLYSDWLIPVSLVIGVCLRTREWLADKSLWLDELMVVFSITHRDFKGLLKPLSFDQAAPVGWLWAEHASIHLFGMNDMALRFPEWAASIVALGIFPLVARRLVGRSAAPAATLIFATSPRLLYFAAETKQYGFDVTCVVIALLVTTWLAQSRPTFRAAAIWGLVCAVLVWCSQPVIPVCAVCGLVLLVMWFRDWKVLLPVMTGGAIVGASVALDWAVVLKHQSANTELQSFWREFGGYPPLHQTASVDLHWLGSNTASNVWWLDFSHPVLAVCLAACGLIVVALSRRQFQVLLLVLPLVAAVGLAVTVHYPLSGRLALYLYPIVVLLLAAPLALSDRLPRPTSRWWRAAAVVGSAVALIAVTGPGVALGLDQAVHPYTSPSGRQAVAFVSEHQRPGDLILAQPGASSVLTLVFYGPHYHVREQALFYLRRPRRDGTCADPFSSFRGTRRVWLITAALAGDQPANRNQIYLASMAAYGKLVLSYTGVSAAGAYLFDLSGPPAHEAPTRHPSTAMDCLSIRSVPDLH